VLVAVVRQGFFGAIPWNALGFTTLWLQYIGLSDAAAATVAAAQTLGGLHTAVRSS
jgi:hypothetical protein